MTYCTSQLAAGLCCSRDLSIWEFMVLHAGKLLRISGLLIAIVTSGCSTIPVEERARVRSEVDTAAIQVLDSFVTEAPGLDAEITESVGYLAGTGTLDLYGLVGRANTIGVLEDRMDQTRTYMNISEFSMGVALGSADLQVLVVVKSHDRLEKMKQSTWLPAADLISIAGEDSGITQLIDDDLSVYIRSVKGAAVGADLRVARISVNTDLTDAGVSNAGIPTFGTRTADQQGEGAPRIWQHKLPFLAQKVVDSGYDLPLPYGLGMTYVNLEAEQELTGLSVGFNGGEKVPFEFVEFQNATTETDSVQIKLDSWLFPFMNVFGMVGKVDGSAPMDVVLDGNMMLDEIGEDCSGIISPPACTLLQDRQITLPIQARVDVTTWTIGTVLAGGWHDWFGVVPISLTHADPAGSVADGSAITVAPRGGRLFDLGNMGSLALFVGGNYLHSKYTIDGSIQLPDDAASIDYTLNQNNIDPWTLLVGFNWDISRKLSWSFEYDGFIGSRKAWITSFNIRL